MNCKVTELFFEVVRLLQNDTKEPRDYGTGHILYHGEMAFLDIIHRYPSAKVSRISEMMGITKGAATQMSAKLSAKGLVDIYFKPGNRKEKFYRLTADGERARKGHQQYHQKANNNLCEYFRALDEAQTQAVFGFLGHLKDCMPFCEFACQCSHSDTDLKEIENESEYVRDSGLACRAGNR